MDDNDIILVPASFRRELKDIANARVEQREDGMWMQPKEITLQQLREYLEHHLESGSWNATPERRFGFNKEGVFIHQGHQKRYFGILRSAASGKLQEEVPVAAHKEPDVGEASMALLDRLKTKVSDGISFTEVSDGMRKQALMATFKAADANGNGTLSKQEIGLLLRRLLMTISQKAIDELIEQADLNRDGKVSYEEFVDWIAADFRSEAANQMRSVLGTPGGILRASFRAWDRNGSGSISKVEMQKVLQAACPTLPEKDFNILSGLMDTDDNGSIDYDEFVAFLCADS
ncbi:unnamed protein product [Polarella glacialis]|uniref:EF-hand domain-containing protein n=1 Tax=Polarella glacialis TaxID=89957 RepID=A0A813J2E8_POLGL|nr:unnamed protein product [Polarella glacialis]